MPDLHRISYEELGALAELARRSPLSAAEQLFADNLAHRIEHNRQVALLATMPQAPQEPGPEAEPQGT